MLRRIFNTVVLLLLFAVKGITTEDQQRDGSRRKLLQNLKYVHPECGWSTQISSAPYVSSIQLQNSVQAAYWHQCGGVQLISKAVLTTATCVRPFAKEDYDINTGELMDGLYVALSPYCRHQAGRRRIQLSRYYIHPNYQHHLDCSPGNIAIVELTRNDLNILPNENGLYVSYSSQKDPNFPSWEKILASNLTAIGYGQKNQSEGMKSLNDPFFSHMLPHDTETLKFLDQEQCEEILRGQNLTSYDLRDNVCGSMISGDLCQGDGGTPVLYKEPGGRDVVVGLFASSTPKQCGDYQGEPMLFTNVTHYEKWISEVLDKIHADDPNWVTTPESEPDPPILLPPPKESLQILEKQFLVPIYCIIAAIFVAVVLWVWCCRRRGGLSKWYKRRDQFYSSYISDQTSDHLAVLVVDDAEDSMKMQQETFTSAFQQPFQSSGLVNSQGRILSAQDDLGQPLLLTPNPGYPTCDLNSISYPCDISLLVSHLTSQSLRGKVADDDNRKLLPFVPDLVLQSRPTENATIAHSPHTHKNVNNNFRNAYFQIKNYYVGNEVSSHVNQSNEVNIKNHTTNSNINNEIQANTSNFTSNLDQNFKYDENFRNCAVIQLSDIVVRTAVQPSHIQWIQSNMCHSLLQSLDQKRATSEPISEASDLLFPQAAFGFLKDVGVGVEGELYKQQQQLQQQQQQQQKYSQQNKYKQRETMKVSGMHRDRSEDTLYNLRWELDQCGLFVNLYRDILLQRRLCGGTFGCVYNGLWTTPNGQKLPVAVKIMKTGHSDTPSWQMYSKQFMSEINMMASIRSDYVVRLFGGSITRDELAIVMELMEGGSLDHHIRRRHKGNPLPYKETLIIGMQIAKGLSELHPNVVHRDLKPQNILLNSKGDVKIADLGLSKMKQSTYMTASEMKGTPAYIAPEVFSGKEVSEKCDIYALGMILWECVTGDKPWSQYQHPAQIMHEVMLRHNRPHIPKSCPEVVGSTIQKCWEQEPYRRLSAYEVGIRLQRELERVQGSMLPQNLNLFPQATNASKRNLRTLSISRIFKGLQLQRQMSCDDTAQENNSPKNSQLLNQQPSVQIQKIQRATSLDKPQQKAICIELVNTTT